MGSVTLSQISLVVFIVSNNASHGNLKVLSQPQYPMTGFQILTNH